MKKYFVRWWLMCCLMIFGAIFMQVYGIWEMINTYDVTKISFLILVLFVGFTVRAGLETYHPTQESYRKIRTMDFYSDKFLVLGMIGTVLGFIYTLHTCFEGVDVSNPQSMQGVIQHMSIGMSTALFTTAAGLICSLLLKLEIFNLQQAIGECNNA
jgi:hypothetical protein